MSHAVTITRTVTTTNTSAIIINTGYLKTGPGLLKLLQLILGGTIIGLILWNYQNTYLYNVPILFIELMATSFFICTFCLLLACIFSLSTGGLISKTIYEFIYHFVGAILLLIASIMLYMKIEKFSRYGFYDWYLSVAILGFMNSILYFISALLAFCAYRR